MCTIPNCFVFQVRLSFHVFKPNLTLPNHYHTLADEEEATKLRIFITVVICEFCQDLTNKMPVMMCSQSQPSENKLMIVEFYEMLIVFTQFLF